jgi:DNA-binding transcriptional LysR family regulator
MTLDQIDYFIEIAKTGSMSQAAQNLLVSQPNISMTIKSLETELGYSLFSRNSRGVELTRQGAEFLYHAEAITSRIRDIQNIDQVDMNRSLQLTVSSQFISSSVFPVEKMLNQFENERVVFAFPQKPFFDVVDDVTSGQSNLGLIHLTSIQSELLLAHLARKGLKYAKLCELEMKILLAKGHPLYDKSSFKLSEANQFPLALFDFTNKEYISAQSIKDMGINTFDKKILVQDIFQLNYLMKSINAVAIVTINKSRDLSKVFSSYGIEVKAFPLENSIPLEIGYIIPSNHTLNFVEQYFIDTLSDVLNDTNFN